MADNQTHPSASNDPAVVKFDGRKPTLTQFLPLVIKGVSMNDGSISFGPADLRIVLGYITNAISFGDFVKAALNDGRRDFGAQDTAVTQLACAQEIVNAANCHADLTAALKTAIANIDHMGAFIASNTTGYSFEGLGEDMPGIRATLSKAEGTR